MEFVKDLKKRVDGHTARAKPHQIMELSGLGTDPCHEATKPMGSLDET